MSLETWKSEFYPVEAKDATGSDMEAVEHSIVKWTGLLKKNLDKHGGSKHGRAIEFERAGSTDGFFVSSADCALCHVFYDAKFCEKCPITRATGSVCQDEFSRFILEGAEPMLGLLKRTKKWLEKQQ